MKNANESSTPPLQEVLNKHQAASGANRPEKVKLTMQQATEDLRQSGVIDNAIKEGDDFVDFELPNIHGNKVKLSERLKDGAVILTFYRGGWCPYCNLQLKAYQDSLESFSQAGGQLIAISPESIESGNSTVDKNEIEFEILADDQNQIARKYGLVFKVNDDLKDVYLKFGLDIEKNQGNDRWELPVPATYVISPTGKVVYSFLNVDYIQRAEPAEILKKLLSIDC